MTGRIGAIVLAGGRSARFGRDKLAEPLEGRPLLHHAIEAVRRVADDVVVVTAPDARLDVPAGVRVVHDDRAFDGPLAGLAVGLAALPDEVDRAIVAAGDMPSLVPAVLARLLSTVGPTGDAAAVLAVGHDAPPLPLAIDRQRAAAATTRLLAGGERRLRDLVARLDARVVAEPAWRTDDPDAATLRDIDVVTDLADMRRPPPVDGGRARRDGAEGRRPRLR